MAGWLRRGGVLQQVLLHIIVTGLVFALFVYATSEKQHARDVKQQIIEKQLALLVDAARPGMSFAIMKQNSDGVIGDVFVKGHALFVTVDAFPSGDGYPFFTPYAVTVVEEEDTFVVVVK